jgi:hypothetical protein
LSGEEKKEVEKMNMDKENERLTNLAVKTLMNALKKDIREVVKEELNTAVKDLVEAITQQTDSPAWVTVAKETLSESPKSKAKVKRKREKKPPNMYKGDKSVSVSKKDDTLMSLAIDEGESESKASGVVERSLNHKITLGVKYRDMTIQDIYNSDKAGVRYLKMLATSSLGKHRDAVCLALDHYGVNY